MDLYSTWFMMPISNDYPRMSEEILLTEQVIMNLIGNHFNQDDYNYVRGRREV